MSLSRRSLSILPAIRRARTAPRKLTSTIRASEPWKYPKSLHQGENETSQNVRGRSPATTGVERRHSNRSNPAGLEHRKKSHPSDDSFFYLFESTRRRRTSGGRSTATTGAERRHSNRSNPAGLEHRKKSHPSDDSFFYLFESTRRDSNPRPSPWQGDTPPLSHSCTHTFKTTY